MAVRHLALSLSLLSLPLPPHRDDGASDQRTDSATIVYSMTECCCVVVVVVLFLLLLLLLLIIIIIPEITAVHVAEMFVAASSQPESERRRECVLL